MGLLFIFINACGLGFSGAVMPGPLLTENIRESYRRGFWAGPLLILGHAFLETSLVVGLLWGLGKFIRDDRTMGVLGIGGGLLLIWMAWGMLTSGGKEGLDLEFKENSTGKRRMPPVVAGAVISLANPFWSLWWAVIGLGLVAQAQRRAGIVGVAIFLAGHLMSDLIWYSGISATIAIGRHRIPAKFFRGLVIICGIFLIYLSIFQFIPGGLKAFKIIKP